MRKCALLLLLLCISICANAQFWGVNLFSTLQYFACQNNYVYNGWGQNIQNVIAVVNGNLYSFPYVWEYGKYIILDESNGFEFSSGDIVSLYWGNQCIGTWTYKTSSALPDIRIKGGKNSGKILKSAWKYIKKIR